jgi:hypothetical protein
MFIFLFMYGITRRNSREFRLQKLTLVSKGINMSLPWHAKKKEEVLQALNTTNKGLSNTEAQQRLKENGPNELRE